MELCKRHIVLALKDKDLKLSVQFMTSAILVKTVNQSTSTVRTVAPEEHTTEKPTASAVVHQQRVADPDDSFSQYVRQAAARDSDSASDSAAASGHRWNEHEYYAKARSDMQKHHHEKIAKVSV
jgi:hypothetical protein